MLGESYHVPSLASVKQMADIRKPCTRSSVYVYEYVIEINEPFASVHSPSAVLCQV